MILLWQKLYKARKSPGTSLTRCYWMNCCLVNLKQQPQTFQFLLPLIAYNIHFSYHWWYKSSDSCGYCISDRRRSLLLTGVYRIMATMTALIWNYGPDGNALGFPWGIFRAIPRKCVPLPGALQLPVPLLGSHIYLRLGETSFTLLGLSAAPCSSLFSSPQLPMARRAQCKTIPASNPNLLSLDSQKSLGTAKESWAASRGPGQLGPGWMRTPVWAQTPACTMDCQSLLQTVGWYFQETFFYLAEGKQIPSGHFLASELWAFMHVRSVCVLK